MCKINNKEKKNNDERKYYDNEYGNNFESFNSNEEDRKYTKNKRKKNSQIWDKLIEAGLVFLKSKVKDAAVMKLQETEEKVMTNIDAKIAIYRTKFIFWTLMLLGLILVVYALFQLFFKYIGYEEWTNMGAGIFFIFVGLVIYFIDNIKRK